MLCELSSNPLPFKLPTEESLLALCSPRFRISESFLHDLYRLYIDKGGRSKDLLSDDFGQWTLDKRRSKKTFVLEGGQENFEFDTFELFGHCLTIMGLHTRGAGNESISCFEKMQIFDKSQLSLDGEESLSYFIQGFHSFRELHLRSLEVSYATKSKSIYAQIELGEGQWSLPSDDTLRRLADDISLAGPEDHLDLNFLTLALSGHQGQFMAGPLGRSQISTRPHLAHFRLPLRRDKRLLQCYDWTRPSVVGSSQHLIFGLGLKDSIFDQGSEQGPGTVQ
jgi:hypothetical protein